jgi:subtilase family serine protease
MRSKLVIFMQFMAVAGLLIVFARHQSAQTPTTAGRMAQAIDRNSVSTISGNVSPRARAQYDQGEIEGSFDLPYITMFFKPTAAQQASLDQLLQQQEDRSSPNFHKWLTPGQFADQFGLSPNDLKTVVNWLQDQGFTVVRTANGRNWVAFSGTAAQVKATFRTPIHRFAVNGETHFANVTDPSVPSALAGIVMGFRGLDDFRLKPMSIRKRVVKPQYATSTGHVLEPSDFATIYDVNSLYNAGVTGTGVTIAVIGQTDLNSNAAEFGDITAFRNAAGLPANTPTELQTPDYSAGISSDDLAEADLDVEWAGAIAQNASIIYVNSGAGPTSGGAFDSLQYAIDQNAAPILSISYGECELGWGSTNLTTLETLAQQANSQGQTILGPGGDDGATDCDNGLAPPPAPNCSVTPSDSATCGLHVDAPASLPEVTGVGGTRFNEGSGTYWNSSTGAALSYIPEVVWNTTAQDGQLAAGGGGKSTVFAKPNWQTGTGVPNDGVRDVPDVALSASPDEGAYLICTAGSCTNGFASSDGTLQAVGGTSASTPSFASILGLIEQETASAQGNINYIIYPLAASYPTSFHDITSGSNAMPCAKGSTDCPNGGSIGYSAGPGYDLASGWGSVDVANLATAWLTFSPTTGTGPDFQLAITPASLTVSGGGSQTAKVSIKALEGFTGVVTLACTVGSTLTGTTCTISPTSVTNSGTATLTVMASSSANVPGTFRFGHFSGPAVREVGLVVSLNIALIWLSLLRLSRLNIARLGFIPRIPLWRRWSLAFGALWLGLIAFSVSCGGGGSSSSGGGGTTPVSPLTSTVTVTGSTGSGANAYSNTAQITVTVN